MENKVTMTRLAAMLAIATGKQKKLCEDFIKEVFRIVADELSNGENVRIKGFGTFKLTAVEPRKSVNVATGEEHEIPGHSKIIFIAAKELASAVNLPFDAFEAVEIADGIPTDELLEMQDLEVFSEDSDSEESSPEELDNDGDEDALQPEDSESESGMESDLPVEEPSVAVLEKESEAEETDDLETDDLETEDAYDAEPNSQEDNGNRAWKFVWGFVAGFVACGLIALGLCYLCDFRLGGGNSNAGRSSVAYSGAYEQKEGDTKVLSADTIAELAVVAEDSVSSTRRNSDNTSVPTVPSDEKVYDTVTTTRFLTTIAKEHYGNFNLWPVIYEENAAILGHPDRIKPGTKVVVPELSKYGIDANNPDDIKKIKQKGIAIYARFK